MIPKYFIKRGEKVDKIIADPYHMGLYPDDEDEIKFIIYIEDNKLKWNLEFLSDFTDEEKSSLYDFFKDWEVGYDFICPIQDRESVCDFDVDLDNDALVGDQFLIFEESE